MLAAVAHKLNDPLHAMTGLTSLLASTSLSPEARGWVEELQNQVGGLSAIVDDLLDMSSLGIGSLRLAPRAVVIRPMLDEVVASAQDTVVDGTRVTCVVADDVPAVVLADPDRLRQVVRHLVDNAIRFTQGGTVVVTAAVLRTGRLKITVTDDGEGIPAGETERVFEPFMTASNGGQHTGSGLGLSLVRQVVALMGGAVLLSSELGKGTEVSVEIPLVAAPEPAPVGTIEPSVADGVRVLVVDDDEVIRLVGVAQLRHLGLHSTAVTSGDEAAAVMSTSTERPDIVLMDVVMPGLDGLEATRLIRADEAAHPERGRAVIIGITADTLATERSAAEAAGMDDFLHKPVRLEALAVALGRWLRGGAGSLAQAGAVDESALTTLAADLGDDGVVRQLVSTFLDELPSRRSALSTARDNGDMPMAQALAHTLRSSAKLLGANELAIACQQLQTSTDHDQFVHLCDEVLRSCSLAARWFQNWVSTAPS
jgi:CheY-like chemotaxis protein/HPt (histidine-containing phosphotransfer) domain-containing protein